jgi:cellulose synthase/poly-beta-1,6-N-acetylglucosamine synthase-like glycosyltransferase
MTSSDIAFVCIYLGLMALLSAVAFHRFLLALAAKRARKREPVPVGELPTVLVQVPLYNERYVAERVIAAVCDFDYPASLLSIQILDDSTDGTSAIVAATVERFARQGVNIEHVRRGHRDQYKAGALAYGLSRSTAELVAVFDADFLPPKNLLRDLVPEFQDKGVGMVQARWGHINRDESVLTEAEAILLNGHFANEHGGRFARGCFFNFNGTAGMWRRAAIDDAGGWSGATLTEDLDLSYRAQLRGWRFVYREDVECPGELPPDTQAFKAQQHRWAKGSIETALLLLPRIWKSALPRKTKLEATFHLAGNFAYPLVLLLTVLMPWAITIRLSTELWVTLLVDAVFLVGSTGSLISFYMLAENRVGTGRRALRYLAVVLSLGIGMAVNNTRAVVEALMAKRTAFNRTPKFGGLSWTKIDPGYLVQADWQSLIELVFGAYLLGGVFVAIDSGRYVALPFLGLFAFGFLYLALGSLWRSDFLGKKNDSGKALTALGEPKRI